jgi:hypothetical protein
MVVRHRIEFICYWLHAYTALPLAKIAAECLAIFCTEYVTLLHNICQHPTVMRASPMKLTREPTWLCRISPHIKLDEMGTDRYDAWNNKYSGALNLFTASSHFLPLSNVFNAPLHPLFHSTIAHIKPPYSTTFLVIQAGS